MFAVVNGEEMTVATAETVEQAAEAARMWVAGVVGREMEWEVAKLKGRLEERARALLNGCKYERIG